MQMLIQVLVLSSAAMSIVSFVLFVIFARSKQPTSVVRPTGLGQSEQQAGLSDVAKLLEAIGKLTEALAKFTNSMATAGPAIASLVASLVFMGFAVTLLALGR
jgi:hypothetical protein